MTAMTTMTTSIDIPRVALPTIEEIPADRLIVDHTVQRALDLRRIEKMVVEFDPAALGVLTVSRRDDGTQHIIDGQHRHALVLAVGHTGALKCNVYVGLTRADEARMFRKLNQTKTVQPIDRFLVRVVEGDPVAVSIQSILERHGWKVQQAKHDGVFAAVSNIETIYRRAKDGPRVVDALIETVTAAWGHNSHGVRGEIVAGLGYLLLRHIDVIDKHRLITKLSSFPGGALALVGRAKALKEIRGGRIGDAMAEHLVNIVNGSARSNKLPEWREAA